MCGPLNAFMLTDVINLCGLASINLEIVESVNTKIVIVKLKRKTVIYNTVKLSCNYFLSYKLVYHDSLLNVKLLFYPPFFTFLAGFSSNKQL